MSSHNDKSVILDSSSLIALLAEEKRTGKNYRSTTLRCNEGSVASIE
ncbi:MAG TPA: hypothetical protein LFV92_05455 [Rickettsia endosymbiont of Ceroptres masudai]|nr:hypothetical protein [Rickettsia endosymbiont of Ceroptres masudai]